ncbi:MAG: DUF924 family protein [Steroidobacteraceae bacterium]
MNHAREVLDFWFGRLPWTPAVLKERMKFWFGGGESPHETAQRDRRIAERFGALAQRAAAGGLDAWAASPRQRLALILLLDQLPRSLHRGTGLAWAQDHRAVTLTFEGLQQAADAALDPVQRIFFYMPLQHSEALEAQEESLGCFRRLLADAPAELRPQFEGVLHYAQRHRDIVARFGRFPHRNAALGRADTPEEAAWLTGGGERFGQ